MLLTIAESEPLSTGQGAPFHDRKQNVLGAECEQVFGLFPGVQGVPGRISHGFRLEVKHES